MAHKNNVRKRIPYILLTRTQISISEHLEDERAIAHKHPRSLSSLATYFSSTSTHSRCRVSRSRQTFYNVVMCSRRMSSVMISTLALDPERSFGSSRTPYCIRSEFISTQQLNVVSIAAAGRLIPRISFCDLYKSAYRLTLIELAVWLLRGALNCEIIMMCAALSIIF